MCIERRTLILGVLALSLLLSMGSAIPAQAPNSEAASAAVERVLSAHGRQWSTGEIKDSVGEGTLTYFSLDNRKVSFSFTLVRKGNTQTQRVVKQPAGELKQGTDGINSWESIATFYTPSAQGTALQMIESQTVRSVQRLLNYRKEGLVLRDIGSRGQERIIEAEDAQGRKTSYFIDTDKDLITKLEFVVRQVTNPFSMEVGPDVDTYIFSDNRLVGGVLTPFKIERYSGRKKIEEMQFNAVRYNVGLNDSDFRR